MGDNGLWVLSIVVAPSALYIMFVHKTDAKRQQAEEKHKTIDMEEVYLKNTQI